MHRIRALKDQLQTLLLSHKHGLHRKTSLCVCLIIILEIKPMASRKNRHGDPTQEECSEEQIGAPCRGDTLPWNLSKHQRIKRSKSTSGEVLDPAERAVIRIAGGTR